MGAEVTSIKPILTGNYGPRGATPSTAIISASYISVYKYLPAQYFVQDSLATLILLLQAGESEGRGWS